MSDLLIKGMEMPKLGMVVCIHADRRVTKHFDEFGKTIGKAVSVPPHGRLIDADALDKMLKFIGEAEAQIYGRNSWGFVNKCRQALCDAPTVIPASEEGE